jgi:hypothetical protein
MYTLKNRSKRTKFVVKIQHFTKRTLVLFLDDKSEIRYNSCMMTKTRKRRNDCTHLIYVIQNIVTGEQYVGITVKNVGGVQKTLKRRIQKHVQRALAEDKGWALSRSIREHGSESFTYGLLETVRGRAAAHTRERELINGQRPALNTF